MADNILPLLSCLERSLLQKTYSMYWLAREFSLSPGSWFFLCVSNFMSPCSPIFDFQVLLHHWCNYHHNHHYQAIFRKVPPPHGAKLSIAMEACIWDFPGQPQLKNKFIKQRNPVFLQKKNRPKKQQFCITVYELSFWPYVNVMALLSYSFLIYKMRLLWGLRKIISHNENCVLNFIHL